MNYLKVILWDRIESLQNFALLKTFCKNFNEISVAKILQEEPYYSEEVKMRIRSWRMMNETDNQFNDKYVRVFKKKWEGYPAHGNFCMQLKYWTITLEDG